MEGVETPSAASVAAVITVMLWTLMKGIVLVSSTDIYRLLRYLSGKNMKQLLIPASEM